jgi:hypothetical protein
MDHLVKIKLIIQYFYKIRLNMAYFIVSTGSWGKHAQCGGRKMKQTVASLALAGACVAVMIMAAQASLVGAEMEREEFKFIHENSYENLAEALPVTPSTSTYVAQSSGSGSAVIPQPSNTIVRPSPDFTVTVSPDSQRVLNRIVVQEFKNGQLVTRDAESYTSGLIAVTTRVQRSASFTIAVRSVNGFAGSVRLSVSRVPGSASCSFPSSMQVPANGQGITFLDITTTSSTPKGTYTLTVTGTAGGASRSDSVELQVDEEIKLEGGAPSYVMVDDGMGLGSSRGPIADSYSVPTSNPWTYVNGVLVPNYLSPTKKAEVAGEKIGLAAVKIEQGLSNIVQQAVNAVVNTVSSGMSSGSKSESQSSPATTSSKSSSVSTAVNVGLAVIRAFFKCRRVRHYDDKNQNSSKAGSCASCYNPGCERRGCAQTLGVA